MTTPLLVDLMDVRLNPALIAVGFLIWFGLRAARADVAASGALAFSLPFAAIWLDWWIFVAGGLMSGKPLSGVGLPIAWTGLVGVLFVAVVLVAAYALLLRRSLAWPVVAISTLVAAHAIHIGVLAADVFRAME
jgi:hypothetical protein